MDSYEIVSDPGLPPPVLQVTDDDWFVDGAIDIAKVPLGGLSFDIPGYAAGETEDTLRLRTEPVQGNATPVFGQRRPSGEALPLRAMTLRAFALTGTRVKVYYEVQRADRTVRTSQPAELILRYDRADKRLPAPTLDLTSVARLVANPTSNPVAEDATELWVDVSTRDMETGQAFDVFVLGTDLTLSIPDYALPLTYFQDVNITPSRGFSIVANRGGVLRIWYEFQRDGVRYASDVLELPVAGTPPQPPATPLLIAADFEIDAGPYVVAIGRAPSNPPAHVVRSLDVTGGKPPYTFVSSNPFAVQVDGTGTAVAVGNGRAVIRAQDTTGDTVSCEVIVTGATVLMPVRTSLHVDAVSKKRTLWDAAQALKTIWYMPGVIAGFGQLVGLWKQYADGQPGLANRIGWDQDSDEEAYYWAFDSSDESFFRINLNAIESGDVVRCATEAEMKKDPAFIALVETNMWCGFNLWYSNGEHAKARNQPFYSVDYSARNDWSS